MATDVRGRFMWYELMTADPAAAQGFYTKVIGWGTAPFEGSNPPYTMWMRGEAPIGGVMALPAEAKAMGASSQWLPYVGTPNVDETVAAASGLGAKVRVPPTDIPNVGRFAVVTDPQGATFALFKPGSDPGAEGTPQVGDFSWHELSTTDSTAAWAFYSQLFGWEKTQSMDMGPMGIYQMYGRGGRTYGGMMNAAPGAPVGWLCYVQVANVAEVVEKTKAAGGRIVHGPTEVPGGDQIAVGIDPQGAGFAVHQKKA